MWSTRLYFEKPVHYVYCILVQQWADTGDIKYITPISGGGIPPPSDSPAQPTGTSNVTMNPSTTALILAAGCTIAAVITATAVVILKNRSDK